MFFKAFLYGRQRWHIKCGEIGYITYNSLSIWVAYKTNEYSINSSGSSTFEFKAVKHYDALNDCFNIAYNFYCK